MTDRIRANLPAFWRPALVVLVLIVSGCGLFQPDKKKIIPDPPFTYPDLSTPENVISNLKSSWERRDSVRTRQIYDDAYQGTSTDNDGSGTINFSKDQEVSTVGGLARDQNVSTITFTLPPQATWVRQSYSTDPAGWTAIQLRGYTIQVDDAVHGTLIADASQFFEFKFAPTLDAASPTDTTWKIVRWTETR